MLKIVKNCTVEFQYRGTKSSLEARDRESLELIEKAENYRILIGIITFCNLIAIQLRPRLIKNFLSTVKSR